jgi:hypothetical protein
MYRSEIASPLAEIVGALKPETLVLRKEELRELARSAPQTADQYEEIAGPPSIRQVFFVLRRR